MCALHFSCLFPSFLLCFWIVICLSDKFEGKSVNEGIKKKYWEVNDEKMTRFILQVTGIIHSVGDAKKEERQRKKERKWNKGKQSPLIFLKQSPFVLGNSPNAVAHNQCILIRLELLLSECSLLIYQNRSKASDICMALTIQQGASGSLMEEVYRLLLTKDKL